MKGFFRYGCPIIELKIEGKNVETLLDTGFNGHIILPQKLVNDLKLQKIGSSDFTTADGESKQTNVYKAKIEFFGETVDVPVLSTNSNFSLVGMELFNNCKIVIEKSKNFVERTLNNSIFNTSVSKFS